MCGKHPVWCTLNCITMASFKYPDDGTSNHPPMRNRAGSIGDESLRDASERAQYMPVNVSAELICFRVERAA